MKEKQICLGLEGTAHTFGVGIVDENGKILADERDVYIPKPGKGIVPNEAKEHHEKIAEKILEKALENASLTLNDISLIAYSAGPGLPPPLTFTANFAIKLSKDFKKPIIQVNHCCGHIEIGKLQTNTKDPLVVYLSGGNTQLIAYVEKRYRIFGETIDVPLGNCLDVVAREMGLPMPGGPQIEKLAEKGKYVELPYTVKGMDVSFSGIETAAINLLKKGIPKEDIAYSLQETCFAMLTEVTERALAHTEKNEVLLVGGVAANKRLQEMMKVMCEERSAKMYVVPTKYSGDNGVMIAWVGLLAYKSGWKPNFKDKIRPKWRVDEVEVTWV
jgi:N6-L-threonylcarbamoyladenine synthase/protein kinase Bud32